MTCSLMGFADAALVAVFHSLSVSLPLVSLCCSRQRACTYNKESLCICRLSCVSLLLVGKLPEGAVRDLGSLGDSLPTQ